jgi:uncharacterized protein YjbI with pentapeptide repeats
MANEVHLAKLHEGVEAWNRWRQYHPEIRPNLEKAPLSRIDLTGFDLSDAHLLRANLREGRLCSANLSKALLSGAKLNAADLSKATLIGANLCGADLHMANLSDANLTSAQVSWTHLSKVNLERATLNGANLSGASLVETKIADATFTDCRVYGISAWDLEGEPKEQLNLLISRPEWLFNESTITVDNLYVAQFIYMRINYPKLNKVIDTITSKVVLILGRFSSERKATLDAMREELRHHDLVPVMFDFDRPSNKTLIETVSTLAHMSRFIIADFTDPKIVLQEVPEVVKSTSVPLQPLLHKGAGKPTTLLDLEASGRTTILPTFAYDNDDHLIRSLKEGIIEPVNDLVEQLTALKHKTFEEFDRKSKEARAGKLTTNEELAKLKERGILKEAEFDAKKKDLPPPANDE